MDYRTDLYRAVTTALMTIVGASLLAPAGRADLIYFRKGGNAQIPVRTDGNRVFLAMPDGDISLPRELIMKRVPGFWPAAEWTARRQKALAEGFAARYAAVWWAIENGLTTEVTDELRALHTLDPTHAPTARMVAVLDRLDQPCSDPDFARFHKALGIETSSLADLTSLFHQHSDAEADERIALLERVITGYHLLFAAEGLELSSRVGGWYRRGLPIEKTTWRSCNRKMPTRSPRHVATFIRRGTPWSLTTRGAATRSERLAKNWARSATSCGGTAKWSSRRRRGAGSGSSSATSRRGRSAARRRRC